MEVAGQHLPLVGLLVLGTVVGLVAGMFGVGGGFLLTPLLSIVFGVPLPIAVGTGLCQMIGTSTAALLRHRKLGQGELRFDVLMLAGSAVGALAGARVVSELEHAGTMELSGRTLPVVSVALYSAYAVLLLATSCLMWRQAGSSTEPRVALLARLRRGPLITLPNAGLRLSPFAVSYVGVVVGFLSGLLGIGGGVALMPILIYGFGFPIRQAAGTGIFALLITVTVGTVQHAVDGHVHLGLAAVLLVGSTISAQFGALLTRKMRPRLLRRAFAVLLLLTVAVIAWEVFVGTG